MWRCVCVCVYAYVYVCGCGVVCGCARGCGVVCGCRPVGRRLCTTDELVSIHRHHRPAHQRPEQQRLSRSGAPVHDGLPTIPHATVECSIHAVQQLNSFGLRRHDKHNVHTLAIISIGWYSTPHRGEAKLSLLTTTMCSTQANYSRTDLSN